MDPRLCALVKRSGPAVTREQIVAGDDEFRLALPESCPAEHLVRDKAVRDSTNLWVWTAVRYGVNLAPDQLLQLGGHIGELLKIWLYLRKAHVASSVYVF
jgi:hypothetical protein